MGREIVVVVRASARAVRLGLALLLLALPAADLSTAVTETHLVTYYPDSAGAFVELRTRGKTVLASRTGDVILTVATCANPYIAHTYVPYIGAKPGGFIGCSRRVVVQTPPVPGTGDTYAAFFSDGDMRADGLWWRGDYYPEWPAEIEDANYNVAGCSNADWKTTRKCNIIKGTSITITWTVINAKGGKFSYEVFLQEYLNGNKTGPLINITKNPTANCRTFDDPQDANNLKGICTRKPTTVERYGYEISVEKAK